MREVQITRYQSFDGQTFDSAAKCREYEAVNLHLRLANLSPEQVKAALERSDTDLGDAIEKAGQIIRDGRRKHGELKWPAARQKAQAAVNAAESAQEPVQESAA